MTSRHPILLRVVASWVLPGRNGQLPTLVSGQSCPIPKPYKAVIPVGENMICIWLKQWFSLQVNVVQRSSTEATNQPETHPRDVKEILLVGHNVIALLNLFRCFFLVSLALLRSQGTVTQRMYSEGILWVLGRDTTTTTTTPTKKNVNTSVMLFRVYSGHMFHPLCVWAYLDNQQP